MTALQREELTPEALVVPAERDGMSAVHDHSGGSSPPEHEGPPGRAGLLRAVSASRASGAADAASLTRTPHLVAAGTTADHDEHEQLKALLTLAASGLAAEVVDGTPEEDAAVHLGRLLGRDPATVVLTCNGREAVYRWPANWRRAVDAYARATTFGPVEVRRQVVA